MKLKQNKEKDKILGKDVALTLIDGIVSSVPGLNVAWGLSKALFGSGLKLRQQKALEWVEMVKDHHEVFTKEILGQKEFQDGFVVALEKYLTERNKNRRLIARSIFLGFSESEDKDNYPLEKHLHTLSQLSDSDIEVLKDVKPKEKGQNYQIYGPNFYRIENIYNLINLGLLINTTGDRIGHNPANSPFVKISFFGEEFIRYLVN